MEYKLLLVFSFALICISKINCNDDDEIKIEIIEPAPEDCERKSKKYDQLDMNYRGTLTETKVQFDSSFDRHQPFSFQLGTGQVIKGWDEGLLDMCVGEKRRLIIPASKGYGEHGAGDSIPPNAGLTFEVELMAIKDGEAPKHVNVFKEIDVDEDNNLSREEVSDFLKKQSANFNAEGQSSEEDHNKLINDIFNHEDADKNNYISHEEFSGPKHDEL